MASQSPFLPKGPLIFISAWKGWHSSVGLTPAGHDLILDFSHSKPEGQQGG